MEKLAAYSGLIEQLHNIEFHLDQMTKIIDEYNNTLLQLNVASLERITDEYHKASLKYGSLQKDLAQVLNSLSNQLPLLKDLNTEGIKTSKVSLPGSEKLQLSKLILLFEELGYEEQASELSSWRSALSEKTAVMDKKHEKLINLLLFASGCNNQWLRDMYSLADQDYKHYTSSGKESKSQVGIGVNEHI